MDWNQSVCRFLKADESDAVIPAEAFEIRPDLALPEGLKQPITGQKSNPAHAHLSANIAQVNCAIRQIAVARLAIWGWRSSRVSVIQ